MKDSSPSPTRSGLESDSSPRTRVPISGSSSWVIVSYPGKKNYMKYIGKIVQVLTRLKCLDIKFVRKQPALSQFMFSNKPEDDDHAVSYHALLQILSDPIKNNREQYSFSGLKHKVF